jgi:hypothetical protein
MNIGELRSGNLVSYKGYQCEVMYVDTFRNNVYIDVSPHKKDEQIKKELDESNISEFDYLMVSIMDVDPIKINEELVKKLNIDNRLVDEYFSDSQHPNEKKIVFRLLIQWDESASLNSIGNVICLNLCPVEVTGDLKFVNDWHGGYFEIPHIRYIHQVQNLYFTLTGKEL